jgi:DNA-damage-inducible protein D
MTDASGSALSNPFHEEPEKAGFESMGHDNGFRFWWGSELATVLGYDGLTSFRKAIERAMVTLTSLNVPIFDNIIQEQRTVEGKAIVDYKLSRFACYLSAMNGDPKKPEVAKAQAYFVMWAEACRLSLEQAEGVERVGIRAEISEHERTLSGIAHQAGVQNYAFFQNAGYRGLYNMDLFHIRRRKGVPAKRSPLDFMGKTELAANLFRVTQTEEKIRVSRIHGQIALEQTAQEVGRKVRKTMIEISGRRPEDLPPAEDIKEVHKKLKSSHREIRKLDKPANPVRQLPPASAPGEANRSATAQ